MPLFSNRLALRSFIYLCIAMIAICIGFAFTYRHYGARDHFRFPAQEVFKQTIRTLHLADQWQANNVAINLHKLQRANIHAALQNMPSPQALQLEKVDPKQIRLLLAENPSAEISLLLQDGRWLNISVKHVIQINWVSTSFILLSILLLALLLISCALAINAIAEQPKRILQEQQQERTQILAALSHDLRTPITRLQLRLENLENLELREKMARDLKQMQQMIGSILQFAKQKSYHEVRKRIDLVSFIDAICDDIQTVHPDLTYEIPNGKIIMHTKPIALRRTLENIINNAINYGKNPKVLLSQDTDKIIIKVEDQGPGIPKDEWHKVIKPFYRLDSARTDTTGSGLGLAIAHQLIQMLGGELQFEQDSQHFAVLLVLPKK